jgi:hypothetical protein
MPSLDYILGAPVAQALPYIYQAVMGSPAGGLGLTILILIITFFCSVSITVAASRCTWAFARDNAIPLSHIFRRVSSKHDTPIFALALTTVVQMLLGLINLGSSSAFLAFVSVGVMSLAISYAIPISISMWHRRREVNAAKWSMGPTVGWLVNIIAVLWIAFEMVLFSMPTVLPVTEVSMNYAIVVFVGFMVLSGIWYLVYAHKGELLQRDDGCSWWCCDADLVMVQCTTGHQSRTGLWLIRDGGKAFLEYASEALRINHEVSPSSPVSVCVAAPIGRVCPSHIQKSSPTLRQAQERAGQYHMPSPLDSVPSQQSCLLRHLLLN